MRLQLEIDSSPTGILRVKCSCRKWRAVFEDRVEVFEAWDEHCREQHGVKGRMDTVGDG